MKVFNVVYRESGKLNEKQILAKSKKTLPDFEDVILIEDKTKDYFTQNFIDSVVNTIADNGDFKDVQIHLVKELLEANLK